MKIKVYLFIILCIILTGCNSKDTLIPKPKSNDSIILYNRFTQSMLSYNTKSCLIEEQINIDNYFQYEFNTKSNYFTTGHSINNNFEIIEVKNKKEVSPVYKLKNNNESIFPLASSNNNIIFLLQNDNDVCNDKIVSYANNKLKEFANVKGNVGAGAILNNVLYYTANTDDQDKYTLYSINTDDFSSFPVRIETGLISGDIYVYDDEIYLSDTEKIYSKTDEYTKASLNYFCDENKVLVQILVYNGDLTLKVIDTETKNIIGTAQNVIDFEIINNELIAYCNGKIEAINLKRGAQ